jgi:PAS domain S-box-containing protein
MTRPRESSEDIAAFLDAITDYGMVRIDDAGRITLWGAGAHELFGYSADEVLGRPASILHTEEDRGAGLAERELVTARESGRTEVEGWRLRKDGRRFLADVVITPIRDESGTVTGFAKVVRDTAVQHKLGTSTFRSVLEAAPDAMLIVGADARIVLANSQVERMFGHKPEELMGKRVDVLIPARLREEYGRGHQGFVANPFSQSGDELYFAHRDGSEIPVEVSVSPLEIEQNSHILVAIRDVSERRQFEERLRRQHDEIMELSTPVIQVWDKVLTLPVIGTLDSMRAARLTEGLLARISETQSEVVIFDISGVPTIDTLVAQHLLRTVQAAALMGTVSIMCGVRPETAQAMVHLGIEIDQLLSRGTLQDALQLALTLISERAGATRQASETLGRTGLL